MILVIPQAYSQNDPVPADSVRQYLFVVETSRAMQRRAQGVHDTLKALLDSNLNGQMRPGDTVAIWTFNEVISTNFFAPTSWSPAAARSLNTRLPNFLEATTYEKRAALDKVIARLDSQLAPDSLLTVILVTTGEEEVQGSPFDNQLRRAFSQWRADQQKARMPILTLLRGSHGRFNQWSVSAAPWPLEIPPLEVALSSRPKAHDAVKTNQTGVVAQTNLLRQTDTRTNRAPDVRAAANTNSPATAGITNVATTTTNVLVSAVTNPILAAASILETNIALAPRTNVPSAPVEVAKTNMLASTGDSHPASDPTDHPPAIPFSAEVPRRDDGSQPASSNQAADPIPLPASSTPPQPTNPPSLASAPAPAAATLAANSNSSSSNVNTTLNLIPPVDDPSSRPAQAVMTSPVHPNFLHENAKWIVGACVTAILAMVCVLLWLSTYSRSHLNLMSLSKHRKDQR